jgi:excisionase family DNA binding protein
VAEELLSVAEAARRMSMSPKSVQTMVHRRQLPAVLIGSRVRIPASAVQVFADYIEGVAASAVDLVRRMDAKQLPPDEKETP